MKLTKQEILNLNDAFASVGNMSGVKFAYAIVRNSKKIQPEIEAIQKAATAPEAYVTYDKKRVALAEEHANQVNGQPEIVIVNGNSQYKINDEKAFNAELDKLREEYRDVIQARENQIKEFNEFLKSETEIDLYTIPVSYVPENITAIQMASIMPIIADESSEKVTN